MFYSKTTGVQRYLCNVIALTYALSFCFNPILFGIRTLPFVVSFGPAEAHAEAIEAEHRSIAVARTVTPAVKGAVTGGTVSVTYTVVNLSDSSASDLFLETELAPGVTLQSSSRSPDSLGDTLVWSLGSLPPFGWTKVSVELSLESPLPSVLDSGAEVYAAANARALAAEAPPALLREGTFAPELLAATPDAASADPYILAKAAELAYDPQQIFDFVRGSIRYESYRGSLRGARGTLATGAGNAFDQSSLLIALFRASGIPARYVTGGLGDAAAQQLLAQMFREPESAAGYIAPGTPVADPVADPQLLAEAKEHCWVEFDADGSGFIAADPSFAEAGLDQTFASDEERLTELPTNLRHTVTFTLTAELASASLFGGTDLSERTVFQQQFSSAELAEKPVHLGHIVEENQVPSPVFAYTTVNYTPYLLIDENADPRIEEPGFTQDSYQEVKTSFPFGSQALTALTLAVTVVDPAGASETFEKRVIDLLGFDIRHHGGTPAFPADQTAISPFELVTVNVVTGRQGFGALPLRAARLEASYNSLTQDQPQVAAIAAKDPTAVTPSEGLFVQQANERLVRSLRLSGAMITERYRAFVDETTDGLVREYASLVYVTSPNLVVVHQQSDELSSNDLMSARFDLLKSRARVLEAPGQAVGAGTGVQMLRGIADNMAETIAVGADPAIPVRSTYSVFRSAASQNIGKRLLTPSEAASVAELSLSPQALDRISLALAAGKLVVTPVGMVDIGGELTVGWYEVDPQSGETIGVMEDGSHGAIAEFAGRALLFVALLKVADAIGYYFGRLGATLILFVAGRLLPSEALRPILSPIPPILEDSTFGNGSSTVTGAASGWLISKTLALKGFFPGFLIGGIIGGLVTGYLKAIDETIKDYVKTLDNIDPPIPAVLKNQDLPQRPVKRSIDTTLVAGLGGGALEADVQTDFARFSGALTATISGSSLVALPVTSVVASNASVTDGDGLPVGTGAFALNSPEPISGMLLNYAALTLNGEGSVAVYGPPSAALDVSGSFLNFTAEATGPLEFEVGAQEVSLNGSLLPPGRYRVSSTDLSVTGRGDIAAPSFSGSVAFVVTDAVVQTGASTGTGMIATAPFEIANGFTADGYNGSATLTAGVSADRVVLS
ncbi:MAG: transglutaminase domain-containing protein, partial [Bdellovibrionales bacterium]|nr:transglutaminase domain-containing protein [Bdellovibrionales bacterium]